MSPTTPITVSHSGSMAPGDPYLKRLPIGFCASQELIRHGLVDHSNSGMRRVIVARERTTAKQRYSDVWKKASLTIARVLGAVGHCATSVLIVR